MVEVSEQVITSRIDIFDNRDTENLTDAEVEVQQYVASIIRWKSVIDNLFPLIFVIFAGAWSDIYGRKLLMILPIFGYLAQTIGVLFCLANPHTSAYQSPWCLHSRSHLQDL